MTPDAARAAHTESLFRSVNERIAETAQDAPVDSTLFICECRDPDCTQGVHLTLEQYEDVRSEPTHFIVKPGHEDPAVERLVEREYNHDVVDKDAPGAAEKATELDPRSE
jgi:hypothetical protein